MLKAIAWSIAFIVLTLLVATMLGYGAALLVQRSSASALEWLSAGTPGATLVQAAATLFSVAVFTWLIGMRIVGLTPNDLRYTRGRQAVRGFGSGALAGGAAAAVALLISVAGGARWVGDSGTVGEYLAQVLKTVLVLAPAALSEETLFRGVPLVLLAVVLGRGTAVLILALLFALAHLGNPNVSSLGIGNIALAGVFLGLAFYAPGGIWTAFGAHLGWNSLLACLDAPVSGIPFRIPLLDYHAGTRTWLTGGPFGPEGGLAATMALTLAIVAAFRRAERDAA
jgi:membrane protease YdiL (CAAX protease family)